MSVSFEGVKVGDRIRLSDENGDFAEIAVKDRYGHYLDSNSNTFYEEHWDTLEILARALPTKPGYYEAVDEYPMGLRNFHPYYLAPSGQWYNISGQYGSTPEDDEVMRTYGRLVLLGSQAGEES